VGKAVAIEADTGFSFDIPLEPRLAWGPASSSNSPLP